MENILEKQQVGKDIEVLEEPVIVDGYWRVPVRWGDNSVTISNFPEDGFEVFDKDGAGQPLGYIKGQAAVDFLKKHSQEYNNFEEFNWTGYFKKGE